MQDALPVTEILLPQRCVQPIKMTCSGDIGRRRAFTQHLLNGIPGNEVNQKEHQRNNQPDNWKRVEGALEKGFQFSGLNRGAPLVVSVSQNQLASSFTLPIKINPLLLSPLPPHLARWRFSRFSPGRCDGLPVLRRCNGGPRIRRYPEDSECAAGERG